MTTPTTRQTEPTSRDEDGYDDEGYAEDADDAQTATTELAWPAERRWRPAAAFLGCVVALGAIATAVVINSGDSATTKATVGAPTPPADDHADHHACPRGAAAADSRPSALLPPETITTVAPTPQRPAPPPPPAALAPAAALDPRTVIYSVTGTKQLLDLVNIVYTDARGFPQTEFNVALPWTKMVVLNPGVQTQSVVATSISSHLDCSIVNAAGQRSWHRPATRCIATCTR